MGNTRKAPMRWRVMKIGQALHRLMYAAGLGPLLGQIVLLLTTSGRRSGKRRVTPLQYEEIEGVYYVGSARGQQADWFRNLLANPHVEVQVKSKRFAALAEAMTEPKQVADYLEVRLKRHPRMVGAILRTHGLSASPSREELEQLGGQVAVVALRPAAFVETEQR